MSFDFDLNRANEYQTETAEDAPIAPGTHAFFITHAELGRSKATDKPMITLEFTVINTNDPDRGKVIKEWVVLEEKFRRKLSNLCLACNPAMTSRTPNNPDGFDPMDQASINRHLMGAPLAGRVEVKPRTYTTKAGEQRTTNEARFVFDSPWRALTEAEKAKLAGQYNGYLTPELPARKAANGADKEGLFGGSGNQTAPKTSPNGTTFDDEIPF